MHYQIESRNCVAGLENTFLPKDALLIQMTPLKLAHTPKKALRHNHMSNQTLKGRCSACQQEKRFSSAAHLLQRRNHVRPFQALLL